MKPDSLSILLHACAQRAESTKLIENRELLRQLVEREPRFAYGRAAFASADFDAWVEEEDPDAALKLAREARAQAQEAHRLDPRLGEAYAMLSLTEPRLSWSARDKWLQLGETRSDPSARLMDIRGAFLQDVGRTTEQLHYVRQDAALDPLSPAVSANLALTLFWNGSRDNVANLLKTLSARWPDDETVRLALIRTAFWDGRYQEALAYVDAQYKDAGVRACWRLSAEAMQQTSGSSRRAYAQRIYDECGSYGNYRLGPIQLQLLFASLGDLDHAFGLAEFMIQQIGSTEALFLPPTAPMRADPRFMPLMKKVGLVQYWQASGKWPDFCLAPDRPYDCAAVARTLK